MKEKLGKVFHGWWIVAAGVAIMALNYGGWYYAYGTFFTPIRNEFGWSRAKTSLAFSLARAEGGFEGLITGPLVDRFGPRIVIRVGMTIAALGFLLMSQVHSFWMFIFSYTVILTLGMNASSHMPNQTAIAKWFNKNRGLALGVLTAGAAIAGSLLLQGTARLIADYGWRTANAVLGIMALIIGWSMSYIHRPYGPEHYGLMVDGRGDKPTMELAKSTPIHGVEKGTVVSEGLSLKEALKTQTFWVMTVSFVASHAVLAATVVHEIPFIEDMGISPLLAAAALGTMTLMSSPGRFFGGWVSDKWNLKYIYCICSTIQAVGIFILSQTTSISWVWAFVIIYGFGYGVRIPLEPAIRARYFGRKAFGTIFGFMNCFAAIGSFSGPYFAGWVFDTTRSYVIAFQIFAVMLVASAIIILFLRNPLEYKPEQSSANI
ncbi:MFS transporter [Chloroflexota bacterium]